MTSSRHLHEVGDQLHQLVHPTDYFRDRGSFNGDG